jgi:hypothetical protein
MTSNDVVLKSKFWVADEDPEAPTRQLLPTDSEKELTCPAQVIVAPVTAVPEVPVLVTVRKLPT